MDRCVTVLRSFEPDLDTKARPLTDDVYDRQIRLHMNRVQVLFKEAAAIVAAHAIELLNILDPAVHTYSYLSLLDTILPADAALYDSTEPVVADKVLAFLVAFDARQVRYVGAAFTHLFTVVGSGRIIPASIAVGALAGALAKIDPSGAMLTSNHLTLARLAYHTNNARAALDVLGGDMVFFPGGPAQREKMRLCNRQLPPPGYMSKDTGLTLPLKSTQVLDFDHLVGLLNCAVRDWAAAHAAFGRVVAHPTRENGLSKIMVEAHRKWILTGLLCDGSVPATPPNTAPSTLKALASINRVYVQIGETFGQANAEVLVAESTVHASAIVADGNEGLLRAVLAAHPRWQIAQLRSVYVKASLADIRAAVKDSPAETVPESDAAAEAMVQDMIDTGAIAAAIRRPADGGVAYVEFLPTAHELPETVFAAALTTAMERVRTLSSTYKATNEQLSLDRDYLRQVVKDQKREKEATEREAAGGSVYGDSMYTDPDDEDLMTGP